MELQESVLYTLPDIMLGDFSTSNKCSNSPFWHEWYPRLRFAFFVIFLVYYIFGMSTLFWFARRRSTGARRILQWYTYPVAVAFMSLYLLLAVIGEGLLDCQKVNSLKYLKIWVAANVFRYFANVIILFIIMFPLVRTLMRHAGFGVKISTIGHMILMGFVAIFMILFVVMWNYNLLHSVTAQNMTDPKYGVEATYVTLYLVAALTAAAHIMASIFKARKINASTQGLLPYGPLLAVSLIGFALMDFVTIFAFYVVSRVYTEAASSTFVILGLFFQGCIYALVPVIATSSALESEAERLGSAHEHEALHEGQRSGSELRKWG